MIICLETATSICSVALCDSSGVISVRNSNESKSHASMLTLFIEEILAENGINATELEAIAVSKGPGSYTGLRIGVSVAKGIAYAASIPLISIDTTLSMYYGFKEQFIPAETNNTRTIYCPMLDARRMEVYYALYDSLGNTLKEVDAEIINEDFLKEISEDINVIIFGDGASKCKDVIRHNNTYFADEYRISATNMHIPVNKSFKNQLFEDVAYFEPFYLKDFITSIPRKNIFGK